MKSMQFLLVLLILLFPLMLQGQGGSIVYGPKIQVNDPDPDSTLQNHPAVVIDDSLRIFVAWQDDRDQDGIYDIYFSKLEHYQDTVFTPDLAISDTSNHALEEKYPRIEVDRDNIYIVWQGSDDNGASWRVYISKSSDAGSTFTAPDTLPGIRVYNGTTSNVNDGPQPKVAVDSRSSIDTTFIYVSWVDDSTGALRIRLARSIDQAASFENLGIIDSNAGNVNRDPDIAVDSTGTLYTVWRWGTGGTNQDPHPWLAFNKSEDHGNSFLFSHNIFLEDTLTNVYRGNPKITINEGNENILITWEDCRRHGGNADPDIFFTRSIDGGTTFLDTALQVNNISTSLTTYENYRASISIDESGNMAAAWHSDPDKQGRFSIYMCAYEDSLQQFSAGVPLYNTFTGINPGTFGNNFYPPGLKVSLIDSVSHFFLVWKDLTEDPNGNIYYVLGWVVVTTADLDIDNNALDVVNDTMDFGQAPAGPAYLKRNFRIVNTDSTDNPDSLDGPSLDSIIHLECPGVILYGPAAATIDSGFVSNLPSMLGVGQSAEAELTLFIPEGTPPGTYTGTVTIIGTDPDSGQTADSFTVTIEGPDPEENLDSLKVFPIPFKTSQGHTKIYFEGLTSEATVTIYDVSGAVVKVIEESADDTRQDGLATWDPADNASGIYFYVITNPDGEIKKGKLAIIK